MTNRMERIIQNRIADGDEAAKIAKALRNALADLMAVEGNEPPEDEVSAAAWRRADKALAKYDAWKATN